MRSPHYSVRRLPGLRKAPGIVRRKLEDMMSGGKDLMQVLELIGRDIDKEENEHWKAWLEVRTKEVQKELLAAFG